MDATSQYTNIGRDCEFSRFTHAEVGNAVSKLKCGKAAGNDGQRGIYQIPWGKN